MFIPLSRLRRTSTRAADLKLVRRRLAAGRRIVDTEARQLAGQMRQLRAELAELVGNVDACGRCTVGKPWPEGAWDGGHCCSGNTGDIWSEAEAAAMALSGTRARSLQLPRGEQAGCAFRGATGCSLPAVDRPNVCTRYLCRDLRRELFERGDMAAVQALLDRLDDLYGRFYALVA